MPAASRVTPTEETAAQRQYSTRSNPAGVYVQVGKPFRQLLMGKTTKTALPTRLHHYPDWKPPRWGLPHRYANTTGLAQLCSLSLGVDFHTFEVMVIT